MSETPASVPLGRATIGDQLRRHAQQIPDKPTLVLYAADGSRRQVTYGELNDAANRIASSLAGMGVGRGSIVGVIARNGVEYVASYYGALKVGAALSGINFTYKAREIRYQIDHAKPVVLIVEAAFASAVLEALDGSEHSPACVCIADDPSDVPSGWARFADLVGDDVPSDEPDVTIDESDLAMVVYTSGTEAAPKGVMIPHRNYLISTTPGWMASLDVGPTDRWLFLMPFHTIAGLGSMTTMTLVGATLVLVEALDPQLALRVIAEERVTIVAQTPAFYLQLMQQPGFDQTDLSCLSRCMTYGGLVPRKMIDRYQEVAPGLVWGTYWGQSELSQLGSVGWFSTLDDIPGVDPSWIGKPVPQLEVRVVDDGGEDAVEGELLARSPSVMRGYLHDPVRTAEVMRDGWLHTGDIIRRDSDGNMFFVDRKKDMIKTGGMNVSSVEVERTIYELAGVQQVAVVGIPDDYWSEAVTAFIVPTPGEHPEPEDVIAHCKACLAGYKVPKRVHIVDDLPKDPQGKILKRELRRQAAVDLV